MPDNAGTTGQRMSDELRQDLFGKTSFAPVFLMALLTIMSFPVTDLFLWGPLITGVLLGITLILTFHRCQVSKKFLRRATIVVIVAVGISLLASTAMAARGEQTRLLIGTTSALSAGLVLLAQPAIVRQTFRHRKVTINTLAAGVTAYMLIGLFFTSLYRLIEAIQGSPFFVHHPNAAAGEYQYFSFVTLTTLGYGDYVPATQAGQSAAVIEAVLGQVFLVTAVARIVTLLGHERPAAADRMEIPPDPDPDNAGEPD